MISLNWVKDYIDLDGIDLYYNREEEIPKKEKKVCKNKKNSIEEFWIYGNSNNHFVNNDNYFIHTKVYRVSQTQGFLRNDR